MYGCCLHLGAAAHSAAALPGAGTCVLTSLALTGTGALPVVSWAQNDSLATLLARMQGILGNIPLDMLQRGRFSHRYFTRSNVVFERSARTVC